MISLEGLVIRPYYYYCYYIKRVFLTQDRV